MVRTTAPQACFLFFKTDVQKARCLTRSSASMLIVFLLAAWPVLKGSGATTSGGMAVVVVAAAFLKCRSASRTNHRTAKLATATKERIGDRIIMSLPPGDRDIGGH